MTHKSPMMLDIKQVGLIAGCVAWCYRTEA